MEKIEYRLRAVTRWVVTRWESKDPTARNQQTSRVIGGEYPNEDVAYEVGNALARAEHERLGWPLGDERIQYPQRTCPAESTG